MSTLVVVLWWLVYWLPQLVIYDVRLVLHDPDHAPS